MLPDEPQGTAQPEEEFALERKTRDALLAACDGIPIQVTKVTMRRIWAETDRAGVPEMFDRVLGTWPDMHLSALTGVDGGQAIEVIYHFVIQGVMVNVRVKTPAEKPEMPTIAARVPAADSYERELHDLLGVVFPDRASTNRLVLPDQWQEGIYPLRREQKGGGQGA